MDVLLNVVIGGLICAAIVEIPWLGGRLLQWLAKDSEEVSAGLLWLVGLYGVLVLILLITFFDGIGRGVSTLLHLWVQGVQ